MSCLPSDNGFPGWVMDHLNKETVIATFAFLIYMLTKRQDESSWSMSWRFCWS